MRASARASNRPTTGSSCCRSSGGPSRSDTRRSAPWCSSTPPWPRGGDVARRRGRGLLRAVEHLDAGDLEHGVLRGDEGLRQGAVDGDALAAIGVVVEVHGGALEGVEGARRLVGYAVLGVRVVRERLDYARRRDLLGRLAWVFAPPGERAIEILEDRDRGSVALRGVGLGDGPRVRSLDGLPDREVPEGGRNAPAVPPQGDLGRVGHGEETLAPGLRRGVLLHEHHRARDLGDGADDDEPRGAGRRVRRVAADVLLGGALLLGEGGDGARKSRRHTSAKTITFFIFFLLFESQSVLYEAW